MIRWDESPTVPLADLRELAHAIIQASRPRPPRQTVWPMTEFLRRAGHRWTDRTSRELGRALGWRRPPENCTSEHPDGWGCL